MASEGEDQCFGMARSEPRPKSYQKPEGWLEEGYAHKIPSFSYICEYIRIKTAVSLIYVTAFASHWNNKPDVNKFLEMKKKQHALHYF